MDIGRRSSVAVDPDRDVAVFAHAFAQRRADPAGGPRDDDRARHRASSSMRKSTAASLARTTPSRVFDALCAPNTTFGSVRSSLSSGQGLDLEHVERSSRKPATLEGVDQVRLQDDRAPRHVHQVGVRAYQGEAVGVDQMERLRCQRAGQDDEPARRQELVEVDHGHTRRCSVDEGVESDDVHVETLSTPGDLTADRTEAHDPEPRAGECYSLHLGPLAASNGGVHRDVASREVQDVAERRVGDFVAEDARGVANGHPVLSGGFVIDGVHADPPADHRLEFGGPVEELTVELVVAGDDAHQARAVFEQFGGGELLAPTEFRRDDFVSEFLDAFAVSREFDLHLPAGHEDQRRTHVLISLRSAMAAASEKSSSVSMSTASADAISNMNGRAPMRLPRSRNSSGVNMKKHEFSMNSGARSCVRSNTDGS